MATYEKTMHIQTIQKINSLFLWAFPQISKGIQRLSLIKLIHTAIKIFSNMLSNQTDNNFNSDLRLIKSISSRKVESQLLHPRSVQELATLLKLRKKQNQPARQNQIEKNRDWLTKKGINIQPIIGKVEQIRKQIIQPKTAKVAQSYFYVDFGSENIQTYLSKAEEYSNMNLIQSIMNKGDRREKSTFKLLQSMLDQNRTSVAFQIESCPQARNSYIQITKEIVKSQKEVPSISKKMLQEFKTKFNTTQQNSLWQIMGNQLSVYNPQMRRSVNMTRMLISSLKMIYQAYERKIYSQDFDKFVNMNYVSKVNLRNLQRKDSVWPKVWLAYCAGQQNKVQNLLSADKRDHRDLMQLYNQTQQDICNGKPTKRSLNSYYEIQDIFYEQFIYNITGQSRFSHLFFVDERSLQPVLIIIRTLGIYYQSEKNKFEEIRRNMVKKYRDLGTDPFIIRNILYLMDYESLVKMGAGNGLMSKEDYLHFLIVVSAYPDLVEESSLKDHLIKTLVSFIIQLINQKRNQYIYYLKLLPQDVQAQETSSIIISVDGLETFEWNALKQLLKVQQYNRIVVATIEKYKFKQGTELFAAKKLVQLCQDYERAFNYLLTIFINNYLERKKYSKEDLQKAEQLGVNWANQRGFGYVYQLLFQFVVAIRQLNGLIMRRNAQKIRQFIATCEFVEIKLHEHNPLYEEMFRILSKNKGLQLYYYFLRLIVKGAEMYAAHSGESEKLSHLKLLLNDKITEIQRIPGVRSEFQGVHLKALREQLFVHILDQL